MQNSTGKMIRNLCVGLATVATLVALPGEILGQQSRIQYAETPKSILTPDRVDTRLGTLDSVTWVSAATT